MGNFSVSLNVKDLSASKKFYENLGFQLVGGAEEEGWVIMKNGMTNIGLFQGMFEENMMTFNPGWDNEGKELESFTDVRDIQKQLKKAKVQFLEEANPGIEPTSFMIQDPDGNQILVDQHVLQPKKNS